MLIRFCLGWLESQTAKRKIFKSEAAYALFKEYADRISKFSPCEISGLNTNEKRKAGIKLWVCERAGNAQALSSVQLAERLSALQDSGARELWIAIGGADGFSENALEILKPDLKWSFGPMTLPHELAAVVAGEQIYRAWTILRKLPYHSGH